MFRVPGIYQWFWRLQQLRAAASRNPTLFTKAMLPRVADTVVVTLTRRMSLVAAAICTAVPMRAYLQARTIEPTAQYQATEAALPRLSARPKPVAW